MFGDASGSGAQLRKHPRLAITVPLTYRVDGRAALTSGRAIDIGGGGMSFESSEPLGNGTGLTVWLELLPALQIEAAGRIVSAGGERTTRTTKHRIVFTAISDEMRNAILTFVFESWRSALLELG